MRSCEQKKKQVLAYVERGNQSIAKAVAQGIASLEDDAFERTHKLVEIRREQTSIDGEGRKRPRASEDNEPKVERVNVALFGRLFLFYF